VKEIFLSVVIPCYDEMANLRKGVLDKVGHFLERQGYSFEVIIVDDGSTDGGVEFIQDFVKENEEFRLIQNSHTGKAGAVTAGVLAAKGKYVLFTDMDQATPIEEVKKLLPFFDEGYEVVIGSRNATRKGSPLSRLIISRSNIILRKFLVGLMEITDTQCGFKMFTNGAAQIVFRKLEKEHHGFKKITGSAVKAGFDVELLLFAKNMGYKIKEVPVSWLYVESRRVSPVRDSIDGVLELLKIRQNKHQGKYK
jgi:dolichyl-phosphate beta-glucosyltransferase